MFEYQLIEITPKSDFDSIDFSNNNNCLLFFHYDKSKIIEDHYFVKKIEEKYKYHVNWIDISNIFEAYKKFQNTLNITLKFEIDENQIILNYIKEYVYDQFLRTCKYYKN